MIRATGFMLAAAMALVALAPAGCKTEGPGSGPPVPASSEPEGRDLVKGAIVGAAETSGGIRLYKILEVAYFPKPVGDELVMIAYNEKANSFQHASDLWQKGNLTVALARMRVAKHMFMTRDYRVVAHQAVTQEELDAPPVPSTGRPGGQPPR
ncbi:MAG: hypothetical protein HY744_17285 [Deltaproteobacteria bacterium]|nr:hypothetical protein [Deltaproteobacteria bacterium]